MSALVIRCFVLMQIWALFTYNLSSDSDVTLSGALVLRVVWTCAPCFTHHSPLRWAWLLADLLVGRHPKTISKLNKLRALSLSSQDRCCRTKHLSDLYCKSQPAHFVGMFSSGAPKLVHCSDMVCWALSRGNNQFPHLLARLVLIQPGVRLAFPAWARCWLMICLLPAKTFSTELLPSLSFFSCCPCQGLSGVLFAAVLSEFTAPVALFLQAAPLNGSPAPEPCWLSLTTSELTTLALQVTGKDVKIIPRTNLCSIPPFASL